MLEVTAQEVRNAVLAMYAEKFAKRGVALADVDDAYDLLREGIIDSLGILEMIGNLEQHFNSSIDFADLDPDQLTQVGPLSRHIANKIGLEV